MIEAKTIKHRFQSLKSRRAVLEAHCEEVAQVILPKMQGFAGARSANEKRMTYVYDETGVHANELLAAGLHGLLTNPATKWFNLRIVDVGFEENDAVSRWLSEVSDIMRAYMYAPKTNLPDALHECYLEIGAFGTAIVFIGERDEGGLYYQSRPLNECFIAENHEGEVDTVYRLTTMTARQVLMKWPDTASAQVREKVEKGNQPDEQIEIVHAVFPRTDRNRRKKDRMNMPFASVYMELRSETILEESGFPEFPYAVGFWSKLPGEEYGRSPGMTALPAVKMLQQMEKTTITVGQKIADPPLFIPDQGTVGPVRTVPGGFIYTRGDTFPQPLETGAHFPITLELADNVRNRIRMTFFADLMNFPTDVTMTATEFSQRMAERMRLLGPVLGRMHRMIGQLIERTFGILVRMGRIPPAPQEIQAREYGVEFVSPIALAQKQSEANGFAQVLNLLLPVIQATQSADVMRPIKIEQIAPWLWSMFGLDPDVIKSKEDVEAEQEQAAQAQMMQNAAAVAQPMADVAQKGTAAVANMAKAESDGMDTRRIFGEAA